MNEINVRDLTVIEFDMNIGIWFVLVRVILVFSKITYPKVNVDDFLRQAATDIITIIAVPLSSTTPFPQTGDITKNAPLDVAKILNQAEGLLSPPS